MFTTLGGSLICNNIEPSDNDAEAFISAAGITDVNQRLAINNLVFDLKSNNLWNKMTAIYPFVGGTANTHKFNLKDPRDVDAAYRLAFSGSWTHSQTGLVGTFGSTYANTFFLPSTGFINNNTHISIYQRTVTNVGGCAIGTSKTIIGPYIPLITIYDRASLVDCYSYQTHRIGQSTPQGGFFINSRTANNSFNLYINGNVGGVNTVTNTIDITTNNNPIFINAINYDGLPAQFNNNSEYAFASIGQGLTNSEASIYTDIVEKYQTRLNRQVIRPIFSIKSTIPFLFQTESLDFFSATGINDLNQRIAVDNLVVGLKSNNLWNKMLAIYPVVGGTANTHKFNLKDPRDLDAAYRLAFTGTWVHNSNGATPDGTNNSYANTFFRPRSALTISSGHFSKYNRTNDLTGASVSNRDGCITLEGGANYWTQINYRFANAIIGNTNINDARIDWSSTIGTSGFFNISRTATNAFKAFRNGVQLGSNTTTITTLPSHEFYLGAANNNGSAFAANPYEMSFASIGLGLADSEVIIFNNIVQTYQSQLNRQV
jgi:hypothetical protein